MSLVSLCAVANCPNQGTFAQGSMLSLISSRISDVSESTGQQLIDRQRHGLHVTSGAGECKGDGVQTDGSNHYQGRAVVVSGSPEAMKAFYNLWKGQNPRELFHGPLGCIKNGQELGAIGGHGSHVHLAL